MSTVIHSRVSEDARKSASLEALKKEKTINLAYDLGASTNI